MGEKQEKWSLVYEPLDYLDGIQSGLTVQRENGAPVAYMFNHKEAVLAASAPDLLAALMAIIDGPGLYSVPDNDVQVLITSAIAAATGDPDAQ